MSASCVTELSGRLKLTFKSRVVIRQVRESELSAGRSGGEESSTRPDEFGRELRWVHMHSRTKGRVDDKFAAGGCHDGDWIFKRVVVKGEKQPQNMNLWSSPKKVLPIMDVIPVRYIHQLCEGEEIPCIGGYQYRTEKGWHSKPRLPMMYRYQARCQ